MARKLKIGISTLAYSEGGYTKKQLDSFVPHTKHELVTMLHLHNNRSKSLIDECESLANLYDIYYYAHGINRGISKSTNDSLNKAFIEKECDIVVSISQDIYFNSNNAFDDWIDEASQYFTRTCIIGSKTCKEDIASFGMSIFTPNFLETIGYTDENFFPAQYDDMDNARRLSLAFDGEYKIDVVSDSTHDSMLSRRQDATLAIQQAYITLPLCEHYYNRKWGGLPGNETYTHPFNDKSIGYHIPWYRCSNPYGKYDRQDQGIVRV